ncbi:MAG: hypothetical protein KF688_17200 [Pirellulales bacterium]|nr:hypothetical protein [Pirellulales bacterium]
MLDAEYTVYRPRRIRLRTWFLLIAGLLVAWSVASYWAEYRDAAARRARENMAPAAGAWCTIVFRSDAVGVVRSGPRAIELDGTHNYLAGSFVRMNDQWIVLRTGRGREGAPSREVWIPREQVLQMELGGP